MYSALRNCASHFLQQSSQMWNKGSASSLHTLSTCKKVPASLNVIRNTLCATGGWSSSQSGFEKGFIQKREFHSLHQIRRTRDGGHQLLNVNLSKVIEQIPVRTFKMKLVLKKRCKDCYFSRYKGQWMVLCKTHPRHKQKKIMPPEKTKWILTHSMQSPKRPW